MTMPLLADSKGVKIGKSEGNVIGLTDDPSDLFGKIMSLGDDAIIPMFTLLTNVPIDEIKSFDVKKDPMSLKKKIAYILISDLHSEEKAKQAEENFVNTFQKGEIPEEMEEVKCEEGELLSEALVKAKVIFSKSEFRRLMEESAVTNLNSEEKINDLNFIPRVGDKFKIGKRRFVKIIK